MSETITLIGCQICGAQMSVKRINHSFPPEGEKCSFCSRMVCLDCTDWGFMADKQLIENICVECAKEKR